jgi:hypothetical protein
MVAVCQFRHQVSEHLRRSREAVQQKHRWVLRRTGFAVEDIQPINVDGFMSNRHSLFLLSHSVSASNPESKMRGTQILKMILLRDRQGGNTPSIRGTSVSSKTHANFEFGISNFTDGFRFDARLRIFLSSLRKAPVVVRKKYIRPF